MSYGTSSASTINHFSFMKRFCIILLLIVCCLTLNGCAPEMVDDTVNPSGFCISVCANVSEMYVNGEKQNLEARPILDHNILFVPYIAVASAFGGSVEYLDSTGEVLTFFPQVGNMKKSCSIKFWLNSSEITIEDTEYVPPPLGTDFAGGDITAYQAKLVNDCIYVPIDYFHRFGVATTWRPAESDRATINNLVEKMGTSTFELNTKFLLLDESIRKHFTATGEIPYDYGGDRREIYTDGHIDLLLSTVQDSQGHRSQPEIKCVTLKDDFYQTDRGLRVGDSEERFLNLYAGENFGTVLEVTISNGAVSLITFQSFS